MVKCVTMTTSQDSEENNVMSLGTAMRLCVCIKQRIFLWLEEMYCYYAKPRSAGYPYFDMLPPEMAEIPIKMAINMAMDDLGTEKHNYLVDVIAHVFPKFKALAAHKSLWQGDIKITGDEEKVKKVINDFLSDGTTNLILSGRYKYSIFRGISDSKISGDEILAISDKCPKLRSLWLCFFNVGSWPILSAPWTSLRDLNLEFSKSQGDLFSDVKLHHSLPNLAWVSFIIHDKRSCFTLPDMKDCRKLRAIFLYGGKFSVSRFPRDLKTFLGHGTIINMTKETFHTKNCTWCNEVSKHLIFET